MNKISFILILMFINILPKSFDLVYAQERENKIHIDDDRKIHENRVIQIVTTDDRKLFGYLQNVSNDSLSFIIVDREKLLPLIKTKLNLNEILRVSIYKKVPFSQGLKWGTLIGVPAGGITGFLFALAVGEGRSTSDELRSGALYGALAFGSIGSTIGSVIALLIGVDEDILWEGRSLNEKREILSQLCTGNFENLHFERQTTVPTDITIENLHFERQTTIPTDITGGYFKRHPLKVSPWAGAFYVPSGFYEPGGKAVFAVGVRVRFHFNLRSGLELNYATTDWYSKLYNKFTAYWSKEEFMYGSIFYSFSRKWKINPFMTLGSGMVRRVEWNPFTCVGWEDHYAINDLSFHAIGGVEMDLKSWLSLEARIGTIWNIRHGLYYNFQMALTIGPN